MSKTKEKNTIVFDLVALSFVLPAINKFVPQRRWTTAFRAGMAFALGAAYNRVVPKDYETLRHFSVAGADTPFLVGLETTFGIAAYRAATPSAWGHAFFKKTVEARTLAANFRYNLPLAMFMALPMYMCAQEVAEWIEYWKEVKAKEIVTPTPSYDYREEDLAARARLEIQEVEMMLEEATACELPVRECQIITGSLCREDFCDCYVERERVDEE